MEVQTDRPQALPDSPERLLMKQRREALVLELRAVERYLGIEPTERALCPNCRKVWNQKKAG